jgi:hypothetical protein
MVLLMSQINLKVIFSLDEIEAEPDIEDEAEL